MEGIIYKYTSPSNKIYIGQTLNEKRRKKEFFDLKNKYGGLKIYNARKKYLPENFKYEILYKNNYDNIESAILDLNEKEEFYIKKFDSINNGYNISIGGSVRGVMINEDCKQRMINSLKDYYKTHDNPFKGQKHTEETIQKIKNSAIGRLSPFKGHKHTEETIQKLKEIHKDQFGEKNPFFNQKHTEKTKQKIGEKNSIKVVQIDKNTDEIIKIYNSAIEATKCFSKSKNATSIINVCKGKVKFQDGCYKKNITAYGYKWKYLKDIEGSTTISDESTLK